VLSSSGTEDIRFTCRNDKGREKKKKTKPTKAKRKQRNPQFIQKGIGGNSKGEAWGGVEERLGSPFIPKTRRFSALKAASEEEVQKKKKRGEPVYRRITTREIRQKKERKGGTLGMSL